MKTFEDALSEHLAALRARDIERFAATLSEGESLAVVGGDGAMIRGFHAVRTAHAQWFASSDAWSFEPHEQWRHETSEMGLVLLAVTYRQTPASEANRFLLLLAFAREAAGWRFAYDQNTPLHGEA